MKAQRIRYYPPAVTVPYIQWTGENASEVNYFLESRDLGRFDNGVIFVRVNWHYTGERGLPSIGDYIFILDGTVDFCSKNQWKKRTKQG